ncbi:hypothetical protein BOTBODRAFT_180338 [Botryobasidium botryosum FD-172 SS1]|uniref:Uncharacterized protein n=1 Tax=Botryobasidium botryosum (strain FD-172 SS1) TaxID=930990 RepID=A0A067LWY7_BOTB1|nr:hypothetical protein BOTBODRAFT_180338 [Botryobasidium botryosum FD-172 SS1]
MEQEILDLIEEVPAATDVLRRHRIWLRSVDPVLANAPIQGGLEEGIARLRGLATEVRERVVGMERAEEEAARAAEAARRAAENEALALREQERQEEVAWLEREAQEQKEREAAARQVEADAERARLTTARIRAREEARVASGAALPPPPVIEVPAPPASSRARPGNSPPPYTPVASLAGAPSDDDDIVMTGTGVAAPGTEFSTLCAGCQRAGAKCIRAAEPGVTSCRRCVKKKAKCSRTEGAVVKSQRKRTRQDSGATPLRASKRTTRDASRAAGPRFVLPPVLGQPGSSTEEEEALTVEEISQRMLEALVVAQYYGVLLSQLSGELKVRRANGSVLDAAAYLRWGVCAVESEGARSDKGGDDDGEGEEDLEDDEDGEEEEEEESVASGSGKGKGRARQ